MFCFRWVIVMSVSLYRYELCVSMFYMIMFNVSFKKILLPCVSVLSYMLICIQPIIISARYIYSRWVTRENIFFLSFFLEKDFDQWLYSLFAIEVSTLTFDEHMRNDKTFWRRINFFFYIYITIKYLYKQLL